MPYEEIQIRVNKEGWVYVDTRGLPAERVRSLCEHLEEVFGPRVLTITDPTEMPPQVINLDADRMKEAAENTGAISDLEEETERRVEELER